MDQKTADTIKEIQIKAAGQKLPIMTTFTESVRALLDNTPNQDEWLQKIQKLCVNANEQSNTDNKEAEDRVLEVIPKLPPTEQEPATALYIAASPIVANVTNVLVDNLNKVVEKVEVIMKGDWDNLYKAYETVKGEVGAAVEKIRRLPV